MAEWQRGEYSISTERESLDIFLIHDYLSHRSYWAKGRSLERVQLAIENSLCFGIFNGQQQVGFARVVTDFATFAWVADVFILEQYRGHGLSKWLMEIILNHPRLQGLRRWILATRDAHGLYHRYGFTQLQDPTRWLERADETVYADLAENSPAPKE
jgi:GNAT superfamily N-acetyltransferase